MNEEYDLIYGSTYVHIAWSIGSFSILFILMFPVFEYKSNNTGSYNIMYLLLKDYKQYSLNLIF